MQITVKLRGHASRDNYPDVKLWINRDCVYDNKIIDDQLLVFDVDRVESNNIFGIEHWGKNDFDTIVENGSIVADRAVELLELSFNGIRVLDTVLYDKPYYVNWSRRWPGERPEFVKNTLFFGWNGEYRFDFTNDIQYEYYRQYWIDEQQAHHNQNSNEFYRDGEYVEVERGIDATIFDLEKMILNG